MREKFKDEYGFMGPTHALSALAIFLLLTAVVRSFIFKLLGTEDISVYLIAMIIVIGASLMPDLDSEKSTSKSTMGIVGSVLSEIMKATSLLVQNTIKSKYDNSTDNPHRGFWHTIVAAVLVGALISVITGLQIATPIILLDKTVSVGMLAVIIIVYISMKLTLASLVSKHYKRITNGSFLKKSTLSIISLIAAIFAVFTLPEGLSYRWVGLVFGLGWLIHIIGDTFTVQGVPILFPIKIKGKFWWDVRMPLRIKAGGAMEYGVFVPLFTTIAIVSVVMIVL